MHVLNITILIHEQVDKLAHKQSNCDSFSFNSLSQTVRVIDETYPTSTPV